MGKGWDGVIAESPPRRARPRDTDCRKPPRRGPASPDSLALRARRHARRHATGPRGHRASRCRPRSPTARHGGRSRRRSARSALVGGCGDRGRGELSKGPSRWRSFHSGDDGRASRRREHAEVSVFLRTRRHPIPYPSPSKGKGEDRATFSRFYSPNRLRGIRPTSEPVRQVARKPAIIAFQTRPSTSCRRWGTSTEKPATFMPTEPMLAKPHRA